MDDTPGGARLDLAHAVNHLASELEDRPGMGRVLPFKDDRFATVAGLANFGIERDASEKRDLEPLRHQLGAAAREDIGLVLAVRAHEVAHVLDHAGHVDLHLAEHLNRLTRVLERNIRRSRDHHGTGQRHSLHQRQCYVARSRRQVDDHVVEMAPFDKAQELTNDLVEHRSAPDDWLVARVEETHRDHLQPEGFERLNAVLSDHPRLRVHPQHERDVGAVNIGIEQADFVAHLGDRDGQIYRQRGLADTPLARADCDDGVHPWQRLRTLLYGTMRMRHMCAQGFTLLIDKEDFLEEMLRNPKTQLYRRKGPALGAIPCRRHPAPAGLSTVAGDRAVPHSTAAHVSILPLPEAPCP